MAKPVASRGTGRGRVLAAAEDLFVRQGVDGTSLQAIADHLGVAKAAVYYQFQTKDDIVRALLTPALDDMARLVDAGEAASPERRREVVVVGLVDLAVRHRRLGSVLDGDPVVRRIIRATPELADLEIRLSALLVGSAQEPAHRVAVSVVSSGLMDAAADDRLRDLDDETLRAHLLTVARGVLLPA